MSGKELAKQVERRVGQCVLTCPTTAVFAGLADGEPIALGPQPALLRRRLADLEGDRRRALLARPGDGRRVRREETTPSSRASAAATCCCWPRDTDAALAGAEAAVDRHARRAQRDHAVSRRRRALGLEGRQQVRGRCRRRPTTPSARRWPALAPHAASSTDDIRCVLEIVDRRPDRRRCRRRDARGHRGGRRARRRRRACCASPPATTAASSGRSTSTCASSCHEHAGPPQVRIPQCAARRIPHEHAGPPQVRIPQCAARRIPHEHAGPPQVRIPQCAARRIPHEHAGPPMSLRLVARQPPALRVDARSLAPVALAGAASGRRSSACACRTAATPSPLAELFDVHSADGATRDTLVLDGDLSRFDCDRRRPRQRHDRGPWPGRRQRRRSA